MQLLNKNFFDAESSGDYETLTQTLTIPPGATTVSIPVTSSEDNIMEEVEFFTVTLASETDVLVIGPRSSATVNIVNGDGESSLKLS